jgi:hypothetical protein
MLLERLKAGAKLVCLVLPAKNNLKFLDVTTVERRTLAPNNALRLLSLGNKLSLLFAYVRHATKVLK